MGSFELDFLYVRKNINIAPTNKIENAVKEEEILSLVLGFEVLLSCPEESSISSL